MHGCSPGSEKTSVWPDCAAASAQQVADRAGISRSTMQNMEKGAASVSVGNLLQVLVVLGLEKEFAFLAVDDRLGRKLEDARLTETRKRAPKRSKQSS